MSEDKINGITEGDTKPDSDTPESQQPIHAETADFSDIESLYFDTPQDATDAVSRRLWGEKGRAMFADFSGSSHPSLIYVEHMPDVVFKVKNTTHGWQVRRVQSS